MAYGGIGMSDHTHKILMNYCRQTGTPAAFTDAAKNEGILDKHDPSTGASIESCLSASALASGHYLHTKSIGGVHVRNHLMLNAAREAALRTDSRITPQQAGSAHIAGKTYCNNKPKHAFLGLSRRFGYAALGFIPSNKDFTRAHIDEAALRASGAADDLHWRDGLPEWWAEYHPFTDDRLKPDADMQSRAQEAVYANAILERLGLGEYALSAKDHKAQLRPTGEQCAKNSPKSMRRHGVAWRTNAPAGVIPVRHPRTPMTA
jgi:hypothetical protein